MLRMLLKQTGIVYVLKSHNANIEDLFMCITFYLFVIWMHISWEYMKRLVS